MHFGLGGKGGTWVGNVWAVHLPVLFPMTYGTPVWQGSRWWYQTDRRGDFSRVETLLLMPNCNLLLCICKERCRGLVHAKAHLSKTLPVECGKSNLLLTDWEAGLHLYHLLWDVKATVKPVTVLLSGLFLVDLVSVGLRQLQEPPDGAQVLPKCAVLGVGALFPSEKLAQPTLEEQIISCLSSSQHSIRRTK